VTCTFTNVQRGTIIVKKVTQPSGSIQSFTFTPSYNGGQTFNLIDGQSNDSGLLVPGSYSVSEGAVTGWDLKSATCDNGNSPSSITLAAGATVTCTFTNVQRGTIIVKKVTNPVGAPGTFTFTGTASGSIAGGQQIVVGNLVPGTYTSTEADPTPAFDLTGLSCDDGASATASTVNLGTRTATFKLDPGETVTCTFTNRQRGHAKVVKTVAGNVPSGSQSFTFQLRSGASAGAAGTILESGVANAADGGVISFATYLVPGQTYQLCEQMSVGWMTNLGPPLYSVYNPSGDNSVVCTDFTVTAGQTLTFNINNNPPPGGMALTIGFWKNWSSCSGGKQKPTLDNTLMAAANGGNPITVGLLVLDPRNSALGAATACKYATNILNKTTIDGKSKKSSDPLFNMAAQLLAADLNVQGGAGSCAASTSAITQAQQLLVKYSWDGQSYSPKLTAADANLANQLATTLDKYNNNKLC
jgi:plastocyanin